MSRNRRNTVAVLTKSKTLENFDKDLPTPNSGSQDNFKMAAQNAKMPPETLDRDLLDNGISPKDLEIEHLTNQIMALTEKAAVIEDMRKDLQAHLEMLQESESHREGLQDTLAETAETVKQSSNETLTSH